MSDTRNDHGAPMGRALPATPSAQLPEPVNSPDSMPATVAIYCTPRAPYAEESLACERAMTPVDPDTLPFDEFMVWLDGYIKQRDAWAQAEEPKRRRKKKREIAADLTTRGAGSKWSVCPATFTEAGRVRMPPMAYGPGCYAIYADGRLVYIGMSDKMNVRVAVHLSKHAATLRRALGEDVRHWTVKYRPERFYGERAMLELRLLRRLKPVLNRRGNGGGWNDQERPPVNQNNYRARAS